LSLQGRLTTGTRYRARRCVFRNSASFAVMARLLCRGRGRSERVARGLQPAAPSLAVGSAAIHQLLTLRRPRRAPRGTRITRAGSAHWSFRGGLRNGLENPRHSGIRCHIPIGVCNIGYPLPYSMEERQSCRTPGAKKPSC
jgi:hypothetical protein